jgi:hypothetical protein
MMRCLVMLLLLPLITLAQLGNEDWTTPIADVKFEDGKIVYTYSMNDADMYPHLMPVSFDKNLLKLKPVMIPGQIDGDDLRKLFVQTDNYLEDWQPGLANNRDKYILLEHCVMKILWEPQEKLSAHALEMAELLKSDLSIDIAQSARLVMKLYDYYTNGH